MTDFRNGTVDANGLSFGYLEAGDGPPVLLLHGFPDNAWTWERQLQALAEQGYRAIAPFLRGYAPTGIPDEPFDTETITHDVKALIDELTDRPPVLIGHDWGALATLNVAGMYPGSIDRAVSIGAGHPRTIIEIFKSPAQLHYAFHVWLFQLEGFAEFALENDDFALVDYLWEHWSEQPVDREHLARVKETLRAPGAIRSALSYYRGLVRVPAEKPEFYEQVQSDIEAPTLVVYGSEDPARAISEDEAPFFSGPYRRELVAGAGHFVQREKPQELTELLLDWMRMDLPARSSVPA